MLDLIVKGIRAIGFQRVRLYLLAASGEHLVGETHLGMDDNFIGANWPVSDIPFFGDLTTAPEPRLISSSEGSDGIHETPLNGDYVTEWACAPIVNGGLQGLIAVDNMPERTTITPEMISELFLYARQASEAIATAKDLDDTKVRMAELDTLQRTTMAVTANVALPALLKVIVQNAVHLLGGKSGGIYEYQAATGELILAAEYERDSKVDRVLKVGEGMAGRLVQDDPGNESDDETLYWLEDGTPYRIVDDYNSWPGRALLYSEGRSVAAVLAVPLRSQGTTIGVLYVDDKAGRRFTRENAQLLQRFAENAAIAMANADLLVRSDTKLKKLGRLADAMEELMGDLDKKSLDERLTQVAQYATEICNAEVCGVFLVKEPGILSLEASVGHREGRFQKGRRLEIRTGIGTGLTGHIAAKGQLVNLHGKRLNEQPAICGVEPDCSPSGVCSSLLAIPLKRKGGGDGPESLVGLIRISNKKNADGRAPSTLEFTKEDEWILTIFAEAVVTAIEGANLVTQLSEQKEKLLRVVESSPSCIIAATLDGKITEFNDEARRILGYAPDDCIPSDIREIYVSVAEARRVGRELHQKRGKVEKFSTVIRAKDGKLIPILLSATWLLNADKEQVGSVGYFEDLRPVEAAQKRLQLFHEANSIVATAESPAEGLQNFAEKLISLLNNSFCRILLLDEDGEHLTVEAAYPISRSHGAFTWSPGRGERYPVSDYEGLRTFLETGEPRVIRFTDEEYQTLIVKFSERIGLQLPIQSLLMVPLRLGKEVLGLLDIGEVRKDAMDTVDEGDQQASEHRSGGSSHALTPAKINMVTSVAAQTCFLIERIKKYEATERRRLLLEQLSKKALELRSIKGPRKLQSDVVRLAVQLVEGKKSMAGVLFVNHRLQKKLEAKASYNLKELNTEPLFYEDGPIGKVALTKKPEIVPDYRVWAEHECVFPAAEFQSMIAIPLLEGGEVKYVLAIANRSDTSAFGRVELEVLENFAAQAANALQTAQLLSPEDTRLYNRVSILHQITEYILSEKNFDKILNAVLTGITAGYGLAFNRAALLLLDDSGEVLEGVQGIGHLSKPKAEEDWARHHDSKLDTFPAYLESLKSGAVPSTPVGEWIKWYRLPLANDKSGYFKHALNEREMSHVSEADLKKLPREFLRGFSPTTELVIVPLHTREKSVGVLVADNKFNGSLISDADKESIITYANTTALAIDNLKLLKRLDDGREWMQSLFKAVTTLRVSIGPNQVLEDIVKLSQQAVAADWTRILLIDELGRSHMSIPKGSNNEAGFEAEILAEVSASVMQTGLAVKIENTQREPDRLPAELFRQKDPQALLCLPLAMHDRKFGVMWIGYRTPRILPDILVEALQLYINQTVIAYDSARRMEELEEKRQAAEALAKADDPQKVLEEIVTRACTALRADSAAIWPYDDMRDEFVPEGWVSSHIPPEYRREFWKAQPRVSGTSHTVMKKGLISVRNVQDESSYPFLGSTTRRLLRRIKVQSFLGVSLAVGVENLGVLYVNYDRPRNFSNEEEEIARTFANHGALALKKAKLLKYVQKAKKAAEAVAKTTVVGDLKQSLEAIVRETKAALDCDAVVLFVYDRALKKLAHPPYMDNGVRNQEAAMRLDEVHPKSIVYKILERDGAVFIEDAEFAPLTAERRFRKEEKIKSLVAIPLKADAEKVGVMFVNYRVHHRFTEEEQDNIELFANQAAVAIRNAQLFEKRLHERNDLLELSRQVLNKDNLKGRMQAVVDWAAQMLQAEFCAITVPEEEGDESGFIATYGWDKETIRTIKLKAAHGSQTGYTIAERKPIIVDDFKTERRFAVHQVLKDMDVRSSVSVPMVDSHGNVSGVILIHSRQPGRFKDEVVFLKLIANQAAIALQGARQFEAVNRKRKNMEALYEASKAITARFRPDPQSTSSDRSLVLDEIIKQAVEGIVTGPGIKLGMIKLYDETADEFVFESVYPASRREELLNRIAKLTARSGEDRDDRPRGVVGMAVKTRQPQLIPDVKQCAYYIEGDPSTRSQLAVPLIIDEKVRGVINIESDKVKAFDQDDVTNLQALAELAVIVIRNSELFDELLETKGIVDSSNELAHMGMTSSIWRHAIVGHAYNIKNLTTLMRSDINGWNLNQAQSAKFEERLQFIESMSEKIWRQDVIPPLSYEETVEVISINELIRDRLKFLWKSEPYAKVVQQLDLAAEDLKVRVSPEWFRRALDVLIDNAVESMRDCESRTLTLSTSRVKDEVEIGVTDTGRGIPTEVVEELFKKRIRSEDRHKGFGVGLLIAKTIVETYKGKISLKETTSHGTTFTITLPATA